MDNQPSLNDIAVVNNQLYISTSDGLYKSNVAFTQMPVRISDKNKLLNQCIYNILPNKNDLYLSSNLGLLRYNTVSGDMHKFELSDGLQELEYNKTAPLKIIRQHVFWWNKRLEHLSSRQHSIFKDEAKIFVSEILINDQIDTV
ncbi:MAG: hypothetical protein IPO92_16455 [Saprospiraceae bacterium]|nr:hypothetical protein [Saprospiraceae bacterium]